MSTLFMMSITYRPSPAVAAVVPPNLFLLHTSTVIFHIPPNTTELRYQAVMMSDPAVSVPHRSSHIHKQPSRFWSAVASDKDLVDLCCAFMFIWRLTSCDLTSFMESRITPFPTAA